MISKLDATPLSTEDIGKSWEHRLQQTGNNAKIFQIMGFAEAYAIVGATTGKKVIRVYLEVLVNHDCPLLGRLCCPTWFSSSELLLSLKHPLST
jgi:hypothetical protein